MIKQRIYSSLGLVVIMLISIIFVGCGKSIRPPSWYPTPPQDPNYLFAAITATSRDQQLAVDKAKQDGRMDISAQIEARVSGLIKKFDEEVGRTEDSELLGMYTQVSMTVVDQTLVGCRARQQVIQKEGELYRAYVLMEVSLGFAKEVLADQLKKQEALYTRFRASKAFKEMEKEVEKLRKMKKEEEKEYKEFNE